MEIRKLTDEFYIGPQPLDADLDRLAAEGVKTVIDLREPSETRTPNAELVRRHRLGYVNIPVSVPTVSEREVGAFREAIAREPGPYFVHCATGTRAAAFCLIAHAERMGWDAASALSQWEKNGISLHSAPRLRALVEQSLSSSGARQPAATRQTDLGQRRRS